MYMLYNDDHSLKATNVRAVLISKTYILSIAILLKNTMRLEREYVAFYPAYQLHCEYTV